MTVLFARLIVDGLDKGVHVFAIKIRDDNHDLIPGVVIGDCGKKIGIDSIDNGFLLFKNYRVPYDTLLDKLSHISPEGKFKSSVKNNDKRLGIIIGGIIRGRICVISGSEVHMRIALTIALRYGALRKQFAKKNQPESSILDYQTHQVRLLPHLAKMFAIRAGVIYIMGSYDDVKSKAAVDPECIELTEYHAILSCFKGIASSYGMLAIQECREACGGHGYSAFSALGDFRNKQDIHTTWEGDNTILMQQTGKIILKQAQNLFKGDKITNPNLQYLTIDFDHIKAFKSKFTDRESLLNEGVLMELMEYRVNYSTNNSMSALRENAANYDDVLDAWNNTQAFYVQEIGKSYGEFIMASKLLEMVKKCELECPKTGSVFRSIFYLYVIERLEKHLGMLLEYALTASQAKLIRDTEIFLCLQLKDISVRVIDSIATPDAFIGSVLGESDGQAYSKMIQAVESSPNVYDKPSWLPLLQKIKSIR